MTTAEDEGRVIFTEISSSTIGPVRSSRGIEYLTTVVVKEDWTRDPLNGRDAGQSYRVTEKYLGSHPYIRGQYIGRSQQPWSA